MSNRFTKFLLLFLILVSGIAHATTKHALIIAIGNYPADGGWRQLSSLTDAQYIRKTLVANKFDDKNIKTVSDASATVAGINAAFEQLIKDAGTGDVVVIHFSCHGERVTALDKNKLGGYDQCAVTFNAKAPEVSKNKAVDQADYYRGQWIGKYLQRLRAKIGKSGDMVVFMDYCHSGAGTRGSGTVRGGKMAFDVEENGNKAKQTNSDLFITGNEVLENEAEMASFVAISATRPEELDLETNDNGVKMGSLTYAISKTFEHLDAGTTYRSVFASIQSVMNEKVPEQHPLIEGNGLDRQLFGGNFVAQKPYLEIDELDQDDNQLITIKGGTLAGLDTGAKVAIYPSGTTDPGNKTALATGIVVESKPFTSTIHLDQNPRLGNAQQGWAFVTEPVYKRNTINVQMLTANNRKKWKGAQSMVFSEAEVSTIQGGLKGLDLITFDNSKDADLLIVKGPVYDSMLTAVDGSLIDTIRNIGENIPMLKTTLNNYAQYKFLKGIAITDYSSKVEVKLLHVINGKPDTSKIRNTNTAELVEFHNKERMAIWVKNMSNHPVYINVLDMQPNGIINPIYPRKKYNLYPWDLRVEAGQEHIFDRFIDIFPPFGTEVFKIFVSPEQIDMEGVANNGKARAREGGARGKLSVMEQLVKSSKEVGTRGGGVESSSNADGSTFNVVFRIVE